MFGFVDPESGFGILISVKMVIMAALGGAGLLFGPLVGALILVPLEEISNSLLGGRAPASPSWSTAPSSCIIARFLPSGLLSLFMPAVARQAARRAASAPCCLTRSNVIKAFGAFKAVDDASVAVEEGEILGLIGPNGAGKSTFFNCLTGDLPSTSGTVPSTAPTSRALPPEARARLGIARTFQVPLTFESMSVLDNVMIGAFLRHPNAARGARQGARRARAASASAAGRRAGQEPRHARPQAAGDRPRARLRAQGAAARRGDGRPDADRGARRRSTWCAASTAAASPS